MRLVEVGVEAFVAATPESAVVADVAVVVAAAGEVADFAAAADIALASLAASCTIRICARIAATP